MSANWYQDPFGRGEHRYWDGQNWTEHIAANGRQSVDPPIANPPVPATNRADEGQRHRGMVDLGDDRDGIEALFKEQVLVVKQKPKVFEVKAEYAIYDDAGHPLAAVHEVGHSFAKRALGGKNYYQDATRRLEVVDPLGRVLIRLHRPNKFMRSKMLVTDDSGVQLGSISQKTFDFVAIVGMRISFTLESGGQSVGSITADNVNASDCAIRDEAGVEVAVIARKWAAKSVITKADNYVLRIQQPLEEPLRSLVIASVFAIDITLRQGNFSGS